MRIINLIDNEAGKTECSFEHGLSFYIETTKHKLLVDFGPSKGFITNAKLLGVDLKNVDIAFLSHGHYDHSGGIIPFSELNDSAPIYMQKSVSNDYYSEKEGGLKYIGIDKEITSLNQVKIIEGDLTIDDELSLFVMDDNPTHLPFTDKRLKVKLNGEFEQDLFEHEQFLVVQCEGKNLLFSGCAHNGIVNIMEEYKKKYEGVPDYVISGFHLMQSTPYTPNEVQEVIDTAKKLMAYDTTFYTCHCTGLIAYNEMKKIMGDKLHLVRSGDEIII